MSDDYRDGFGGTCVRCGLRMTLLPRGPGRAVETIPIWRPGPMPELIKLSSEWEHVVESECASHMNPRALKVRDALRADLIGFSDDSGLLHPDGGALYRIGADDVYFDYGTVMVHLNGPSLASHRISVALDGEAFELKHCSEQNAPETKGTELRERVERVLLSLGLHRNQHNGPRHHLD